MDMLVEGSDLSYQLDAMGGKLTPSAAKLTLNQVDGMDDSTLGLDLEGGADRSSSGDRVRSACGKTAHSVRA